MILVKALAILSFYPHMTLFSGLIHVLTLYFLLQCSFKPPCNCDKEVNREKVVQFIKLFRHPGTSFSCLYNPAKISEIIRDRTPNVASQWARVLLPSIAFLLCLLALLVVLILRKQNVWTVIKAEEKLQTQGWFAPYIYMGDTQQSH